MLLSCMYGKGSQDLGAGDKWKQSGSLYGHTYIPLVGYKYPPIMARLCAESCLLHSRVCHGYRVKNALRVEMCARNNVVVEE